MTASSLRLRWDDPPNPKAVPCGPDIRPDPKGTVFERKSVKMVKAPEGDYRDWDEIRAFADEIADTVH